MVFITLTNFELEDVNEALQNTETVLSYKKIIKSYFTKLFKPTQTKKIETCIQIQKSFPECGSGAGVQSLIL